MRVFILNFARIFFYSGNLSTYFKVCVDLCKKSDRTFQFLSTILTGKEERNSGVIHRQSEDSEHRRPGLSNSLNQWTL